MNTDVEYSPPFSFAELRNAMYSYDFVDCRKEKPSVKIILRPILVSNTMENLDIIFFLQK